MWLTWNKEKAMAQKLVTPKGKNMVGKENQRNG